MQEREIKTVNVFFGGCMQPKMQTRLVGKTIGRAIECTYFKILWNINFARKSIISVSVLSALTKNNNKILVSTHDIELTDMLSDEYELYHFSETVNEKTIGFDYKLKEGKLKNRNAIRILEINNYPKEVVKEAIGIAKELDQTYLTKNTTGNNMNNKL